VLEWPSIGLNRVANLFYSRESVHLRSSGFAFCGEIRLRKSTTLAFAAMLTLVAGCATDIGSFTSTKPAKAPVASSVPQQQVATNQQQDGQSQLAPIPPAGQATFAPAPKPGAGGLATGSQAGRKLSETELQTMLAGNSIIVADGRRLEYGRSGSYQETRNGQAIAVGTYQIRDVSVCVQFTTGLTRCDSIVQDGDQLFVEDRNGQRLPAQIG